RDAIDAHVRVDGVDSAAGREGDQLVQDEREIARSLCEISDNAGPISLVADTGHDIAMARQLLEERRVVVSARTAVRRNQDDGRAPLAHAEARISRAVGSRGRQVPKGE